MPIVDLETNHIVKDILKDSTATDRDEINPRGYICRFALNTSLTLNYGLRIGGTINDELLNEVVTVEREIGNLRSTSNNWRDYVPLLRLLPNGDDKAKEMRGRRDTYMTYLLAQLRNRIAEGTDKPCITGNILKDPEATLTEAEVKSLCITMVAGGLDTLPGNIIMTMGYWSSRHGQEIQRRAYDEIKKVYPDDDAYEKCLEGEKIPYIVAMVKESLRFWSTFQISLPRTSIKPVEYEGAMIPAGTLFYMVSEPIRFFYAQIDGL
jgi:phenylacetate 2-hydroxylase